MARAGLGQFGDDQKVDVSLNEIADGVAIATVKITIAGRMEQRNATIPIHGNMTHDQMKLFAMKEAVAQLEELVGLVRSEISNIEAKDQ